jgi:hypothetical protein
MGVFSGVGCVYPFYSNRFFVPANG